MSKVLNFSFKRRILILLSIFTFIFFLFLFFSFLERDSKSLLFFKSDKTHFLDVALFPTGNRMSTVEWERENVFINDNIFLSQGGGYELKNGSKNFKSDQDKINIVIFGDSHLWGNGNIDRYSTIAMLLQDKLDRAAPEIFNVIPLAQNGASTFLHYDYFKNNDVKRFDPDLVIYNYFYNDIDPNFSESLICRSSSVEDCQKNQGTNFDPSYQSCIHGEGDFLSRLVGYFKFSLPNTAKKLLDRHCEPIYKRASSIGYIPDQAIKKPLESPFFNLWLEAITLLRKEIDVENVAVFDVRDQVVSKSDEEEIFSLFRDAGFEVIPEVMTDKFSYDLAKGADYFREKTMVNPGNGHKSSFLNNLYAEDLAKYILDKFGEEVKRGSQAVKKSANFSSSDFEFIPYSMPAFDVKISNYSKGARVEFNKSSNPQFKQRSSSNDLLPFQYANCMNLGYSNFVFNINKNIKSGSISILDLPKEKVRLGFYYYDDDLKLNYLDYGFYRGASAISIPKSTLGTMLVIGFPEFGKGCKFDEVISAPDFNIDIQYKD